jgi:hypothetical protein
MEWGCLTMCDSGNFSCLIRTVKKSKPVLLAGNGCGEDSGAGEEATEKQMKAISNKLGLKEASSAELLAVILSVAGPDFFKTYASSEDYELESWAKDYDDASMPRFKAAGALLKKDAEEKDEEEGKKRKRGVENDDDDESGACGGGSL